MRSVASLLFLAIALHANGAVFNTTVDPDATSSWVDACTRFPNITGSAHTPLGIPGAMSSSMVHCHETRGCWITAAAVRRWFRCLRSELAAAAPPPRRAPLGPPRCFAHVTIARHSSAPAELALALASLLRDGAADADVWVTVYDKRDGADGFAAQVAHIFFTGCPL